MTPKVVLFDADSLIYQAMYRVVTFGELREMIRKGDTRFSIELEILQRGYDRFEKIAFDILNEIESEYQTSVVKYFFTKCKRNFRKDVDPTYKANRKSNRWVNELRSYLLDYLDGSFASDEYEADDLIYFNTQLMNQYDYIICSIDKDLKQIPGIHYDYYQMKVKDENGEYMVDQFGQFVKVRKGFRYVTESEAEMMQFTMMLTGDVSDNVKGVHGIGQKKAEKLLQDKNTFGKVRAVCEAYMNESDNWKERIRNNKKLMIFH